MQVRRYSAEPGYIGVPAEPVIEELVDDRSGDAVLVLECCGVCGAPLRGGYSECVFCGMPVTAGRVAI